MKVGGELQQCLRHESNRGSVDLLVRLRRTCGQEGRYQQAGASGHRGLESGKKAAYYEDDAFQQSNCIPASPSIETAGGRRRFRERMREKDNNSVILA